MANETKYWVGLEELNQNADFLESQQNEFPQEQSVDEFLADDKLQESSSGRRDFLKFMGFSVAAATLAACETPVNKVIPYVNKPEDITPGVANYYASTYYNGQDYGSIMVKTREGRPIHIKANRAFGLNGGIGARINASVLPLYDSARLRGPLVNGEASDWTTVDASIKDGLAKAKRTVLLSNTIISPSTKKAIDAFKAAHNAEHVQYDTVSYNGLRKANASTFGDSAIPSYDFSQARTVVSIGADFQGNWLMPSVFASDFAKTRMAKNGWMSRHWQFETILSLAGTNADERVMIKPSQEGLVAAALLKAVGGRGGNVSLPEDVAASVQAAAADLKKNKTKAIVVAGSNDPNVQMIVNEINLKIGSYGNTIDMDKPVHLFQGNDEAMQSLVADMKAGKVDALITYGVNPAYSWINNADFIAGLGQVETSVSFAEYADETASRSRYVCPDNNFLESWNDLNPVGNRIDLVQPTISPLFKTRQAQESLLAWSGQEVAYYDFIRKNYNGGFVSTDIHSDSKWNESVHNGTMGDVASASAAVAEDASEAIEGAEEETPSANNISAAIAAVSAAASKASGTEIVFYQKIGIGDGSQANNPMLQELPDPVSKVTWDNYITMGPADILDGAYNDSITQSNAASTAKVVVNGKEMTLPVYPQPGQAPGTIGIAIGYGRGANGENIGKSAFQVDENGDHLMVDEKPVAIGQNVFPMLAIQNGATQYSAIGSIEKAEAEYALACTQTHHTLMERTSVVKETGIDGYNKEKDAKRGEASFNKFVTLAVYDLEKDEHGHEHAVPVNKPVNEMDLWDAHPVQNIGHRWGMSIDLTTCTGCSACVTACHIENNVPVVGKDEVRRRRDMHWMRIDRYYSSDMTKARAKEEGLGTISMYKAMEDPKANPKTVHMPLMCQHCNHAPCETVCPVAATTHSNEGLNQMTYNRCIGTRYCANNCPYKVRRFNWFNYQGEGGYKKFKNINPSMDSLARMVLNPDVTVRSRGVMEKCSMCVQRIQKGKLDAKTESRPVQDGEIVTACAESCPTNAISFGDWNDKQSQTRNLADDNRSYNALEEVGVQPNIYYMTKVRNTTANKA